MRQQEWRHYGARMTFSAVDGVAWIKLNGVLTRGVLDAMRDPAEAAVSGSPVGAIVLNLESAALALSAEDVDDFYATIKTGSVTGHPGAWVVRPETVPHARHIAWRIARVGIVRVVFSDPAPARQWALEKASRSLVSR